MMLKSFFSYEYFDFLEGMDYQFHYCTLLKKLGHYNIGDIIRTIRVDFFSGNVTFYDKFSNQLATFSLYLRIV